MKQKRPPLSDRLFAKLRKLGLSERKAKELVKGLAPTAARATVTGTVTGKLTARCVKLGLSERKAAELAKGLAPVVRASIKAKAKAKAVKLDEVDDAFVNEIVNEGVDLAEDPELDKVAPRVNGHRVRLDLPVVLRHEWQANPTKGIELLRVMDGLTTRATYLVAAVKGEHGIVAVRQFDSEWFNVKFYPAMGYWNTSFSELATLGAQDFLDRAWYQRMHFNREALDKLCKKLAAEAKPKSRLVALRDRFLSVTATPLLKAFEYLHRKIGQAA